ncbi:MAG: leucine dehydrogenase [Candidatus Marinimicrobia bacterium]|nr:leucine dehydrogenase [Candidatus Neomarinimicrobiota bacterium]|tara:strand:+ start:9405 stop:10469 length:1065 start_codon:yes stop_codon:yes gene_type:complete
MDVLNQMQLDNHEQVNFFHDPKTNLKAIIAIHSTELGPSLGGCRMMEYESEQNALFDVLRLAKGMTYKSAIAGLKLGGGKSVIIGNSKTNKTDELLEKFGEFIDSLGGRYITAEDMGMNVKDMEIIKRKTNHVTGLAKDLGGSGDPSEVTSYGTYMGILSAVKFKLNKDNLDGLSILVQGLGNVGMKLIAYLAKHDINLFVSDIDADKVSDCVSSFGATPIAEKDVYDLDANIYCPCAVGATVNDKTIDRLNFDIIAGAANNVLENYEKHGNILFRKNILYAPDYVINAGGVINIYNELGEYNKIDVFKQVEKIYDNLLNIFVESEKQNIATNIVSDLLAEKIINEHKNDKIRI